jgi:protein-S-isoprenylcysteine O-methyltransferase Ste14
MANDNNAAPENTDKDPRMSRFGFRKPRIFPPIWLVICAFAMFALDRWLPLVQLYPRLDGASTWLLIGPGLVLILVAFNLFKRADTGVVPFSKSTALVTGGIYRFTRNPMYLGMALILAGGALKLGSLGAWIPVPVFMAIIQNQFIKNEEIFLTAIYGEEFKQYCQRVRRWI